jgi:hypothetical protein
LDFLVELRQQFALGYFDEGALDGQGLWGVGLWSVFGDDIVVADFSPQRIRGG